jgi:hypothetical protein
MKLTDQQITRMTKAQLAQMHAANGGLMSVKVYMQWTKDELINAVIEDQQYAGA